MELNEMTLREGLKFLVGTWTPEFVVNVWADMERIPASDFQSDNGMDLTAVTYTFSEDHTAVLKNAASGQEVATVWEQTDEVTYHYDLHSFFALEETTYRENAEKLEVQDGYLWFTVGVFAIAMKKIAEGTVTEEPKVEDRQMNDVEQKELAIVGTYRVARAMDFVTGSLEMTDSNVLLDTMNQRIANKQAKKKDLKELLEIISQMVEFTADHQILSWSPVPEKASKEQLQEALDSGDILGLRDGMMCVEATEWKFVDGTFYYNTKETREVFGEEQSSWDALIPDADGWIPYGDGMMMLEKVR